MTLHETDKPFLRDVIRETVKTMVEEGQVMTPSMCEKKHAARGKPWRTVMYAALAAMGGAFGSWMFGAIIEAAAKR